ncbi:hypothetical protein B7H23_07650 [Notoacmeibacter marinus]|uniref:Uncharacterized protein n=1 Tax=Notoacmeibacter marinus TaxID=1876515 RepID=A0A231V3I4_9HYPH|nr:hypothetical protein [Notoacmeibacter marinus]OXT02738.1 hypothetical protein B7H23_07650 [Notoacmeibacter marinus]
MARSILIRIWQWLRKSADKSVEADEADDFTPKTAITMVTLAGWTDWKKFGRAVPANNMPPIRVFHRTSAKNIQRDHNVIYVEEFSSDQLQKQIDAAMASLKKAQIDSLPVKERSQVLKLLSHLRSEHGDEGCKRFCELSHLAFREIAENGMANEDPLASFWADFRTFIDVEKATQRGHPFSIEHFSGEIFVINDEKGARFEHSSGSSIQLSVLQQMMRGQSSI